MKRRQWYVFEIVCWGLVFFISLAGSITHHSLGAGITAALALINVAVRLFLLSKNG